VDCGLGIAPYPHSLIPNPQSPIPNSLIYFNIYFYFIILIIYIKVFNKKL